jgi:predicted dehydrogenase
MKALIIGMGIGQLYHSVFSSLGYTIDTVDSALDKNATFKTADVITDNYDIAVICTPNFTHELIARTIANKCKIVLIEKPGVQDSKCWSCLITDFPNTRFMMVKNNQYRDTIEQFKTLTDQSHTVRVVWNNKNRIPHPGSWFTTKNLSFGGVSRDLIPHMLSYYVTLTDYKKGNKLYAAAIQRHSLDSVTDTDYGTVNKEGTYNVDDFCEFEFSNNNTKWILSANWKDSKADDVYISFETTGNTAKFVLGLCPEEAYKSMVETAVKNLNNDDFWKDQLQQDLWIHKQIENL